MIMFLHNGINEETFFIDICRFSISCLNCSLNVELRLNFEKRLELYNIKYKPSKDHYF